MPRSWPTSPSVAKRGGAFARGAAESLAAVRASLRPFVGIQLLAFALVAAYYASPSLQMAAEQLERLKLAGGLPFAALATAFSGVVLPELARRFTGLGSSAPRDLSFQLFFFAYLGVQIDLFYQFQAWLFGTGTDVTTVVAKTAFDMLVFTPFLSIPISAFCFTWRDAEFRNDRTRNALTNGAFSGRYAAFLVTAWAFWLPVVLAVYALPSNLQFMLFMLAQAAYSLIIVRIDAVRRAG